MNDIAERIKNRTYQTPGRARSALTRSLLTKNEKASLNLLVDAWEAEEGVDPVVGGPPAESLPSVSPGTPNGHGLETGQRRAPVSDQVVPFTLNLNTRIRARLTLEGMAKLFSQRETVAIPANLVASGGVWETPLWQFMAVMNGASMGDSSLTVDNNIEIVHLVT